MKKLDENKIKIIGIDPDLGGAICVYNPKTDLLEHIYDMPVTAYTKRKRRKKIDKAKLQFILQLHQHEVAVAVLEKVHSMPRDGHVGAFTFGYHFGILEMAVFSAGIEILLATPSVWKSAMGLSSDKNESREKARARFKSKRVYFMRAKDHGRAEAAFLTLVGVPVVMHNELKKAWKKENKK